MVLLRIVKESFIGHAKDEGFFLQFLLPDGNKLLELSRLHAFAFKDWFCLLFQQYFYVVFSHPPLGRWESCKKFICFVHFLLSFLNFF
jgi:hypothetical protein